MFVKIVWRLAILFILCSVAALFAKRDRLFSPQVKSASDNVKAEGALYRTEMAGQAMGTFWSVKVYSPKKDAESFLKKLIQDELDRIDGMMSTYKDSSELSEFNRSRTTDWFPVSKELAEVVSCALNVSQKTGGAFDVTVGPLVNIWKFGPDKSPLREFPSSDRINRIRKIIGWQNLEVQLEPRPLIRKKIGELYVDLSAIAKGYSVDAVARVLEKAGISDFMIEVGGEIRCGGSKKTATGGTEPWVLGIERPKITDFQNQSILRTVLMKDQSMATSGDYRNYRQIRDVRFSHIIDPRNGRPTDIISESEEKSGIHLGSVTVIMESCAQADAWATAFFVLGSEEGIALANRENIAVLFINRKGTLTDFEFQDLASDSFKKRFHSERTDQRSSSSP